MTAAIENEAGASFDFDAEELIETVCNACLDQLGCPYEAEVEVIITDDPGIHEVNLSERGIDAPTDVLSFPMAFYDKPADFEGLDEQDDVFNPETGAYMLGSMMISADRVKKQAEEYGHSEKRELAFLTVHSMLHLMGYDHIEEDDRILMEAKQREILESLGITR
ncbi:MAG: rRNA maturation RNase YbeY [Lachnospiraceae bacterium]|nr:rRNA maturation RNase YbeY [Lachnospiraceae bacterium]